MENIYQIHEGFLPLKIHSPAEVLEVFLQGISQIHIMFNQIWREIHPNHPVFSHNFPKA